MVYPSNVMSHIQLADVVCNYLASLLADDNLLYIHSSLINIDKRCYSVQHATNMLLRL